MSGWCGLPDALLFPGALGPRRVLQLEVASHKTPERVDFVARNLLGMAEPSKDRIFSGGVMPTVEEAEEDALGGVAQR